MNVLLTTINSKYIHQNLAVRLLYELNKHYSSLSVKEFTLKNNHHEVAVFCSNYSVIAFSCYIWNITPTLHVAQKIKQLNNNCKILLGGPEVSYDYANIINLPFIDYIIRDEGEVPFSAFLNFNGEPQKIPALVYKNNNKIIENSLPDAFDLNGLSSVNPYKSYSYDELKHKVCYIESSRGCPNNCSFCLAGLDNKLRYLPLQAIHNNLLYLMEHGRVIKFLDRTFNTHPKFAISIFSFIIDNYKPGNVFQFEIKADVIQPSIISFINDNVPKGLFRFEIGIQTLNEQSNVQIKRYQNFENIKYFINQVSHIVDIHLDLIVGLPNDYYNDIVFSFEHVFKLFAPELQLGFLKFLKGTPIRQNSESHNYVFDAQPPYQIIESKYLTNGQINDFIYVEHVLDIYWNKKRALYTLRYVALNYRIFNFLLGLGKYNLITNGNSNTGLTGVYNTLFNYCLQCFDPGNIVFELVALDYYLHHKIKPATLYLPQTPKQQRIDIFTQLKLNHHKYRYVIHNVHFNVQKLITGNIFEPADDVLIIEFSGVDVPRVIKFL